MASGGRDGGMVTCAPFVLGKEPGAIVAGFDVHRRQITIDALDTATGDVSRGQIESTPAAVEQWVAGFPGRVIHVAVEACTGWLFVCRALERSGAIAHLRAVGCSLACRAAARFAAATVVMSPPSRSGSPPSAPRPVRAARREALRPRWPRTIRR